MISESAVEKHLVKRVKELGGKCYKWVSPGNTGVMDRICVMPHGVVYFVELKNSKGRLSKRQALLRAEFMTLGHRVLTINSIEEVDVWYEENR